jgi:hypothetical protein
LLGECFCLNELTTLIHQGLGMSFFTQYNKISKTPLCQSFYQGYTAGEALTYLATFLVVIINALLQKILYILNRNERHGSVSNEQGAYMLKLFVAQYMNTALVPLLAFGKVDDLPYIFQETWVLQGLYPDFTSAWYGNVGSYLMLTFIVQFISQPAWPLFQCYIWYPLSRCISYPSIR